MRAFGAHESSIRHATSLSEQTERRLPSAQRKMHQRVPGILGPPRTSKAGNEAKIAAAATKCESALTLSTSAKARGILGYEMGSKDEGGSESTSGGKNYA